MKRILFICLFVISSFITKSQDLSLYNIIWSYPYKDPTAVMPIGNGDIAAGIYAIEDGDLYMLLSKNDAFSYAGDLLKTSRIKINFSPNPFTKGDEFKQILDIEKGCCSFCLKDLEINIWADANNPVYNICVKSKKNYNISISFDTWKRIGQNIYNYFDVPQMYLNNIPEYTGTQDSIFTDNNRLYSCYNVGNNSVFQSDLDYYNVGYMSKKHPDPYKNRIFGNMIESKDLILNNNILQGKGNKFNIKIYALSKQLRDVNIWKKEIDNISNCYLDVFKHWKEHLKWWKTFWNKSWIIISDNTLHKTDRNKLQGELNPGSESRKEKDGGAIVAQSYNIFRYLMACQSRGKYPVKFNGGLFTQQLRIFSSDNLVKRTAPYVTDSIAILTHEDDRMYGRRFTFQNQRLLYWPLLGFGDFEFMHPFFSYYLDLLLIRKAVTKEFFGHGGAYYRENIDPTGCERDCGQDGFPSKEKDLKQAKYYHDYYFTCGLEKIAMMLEYIKYTNDTLFFNNQLLPFAKEIMLFFDLHYERDSAGKISISPTQVLETFWFAFNGTPDLAGLKYCLSEILKREIKDLSYKSFFQRLYNEIPDINIVNDIILPAYEYGVKNNFENGELYPIFPFNLYGVARENQHIISNTMEHRTVKDAWDCGCWSQDQIMWAYAGNAEEASKGLEKRFRIASKSCRFPLFGREYPDACPDFDHFGSGSIALQKMLVQENDKEVHIFPAWPKKWDVNFKIHISNGFYIIGDVKNGVVRECNVFPKETNKKIVIHKLQ